MAKVYKKVNVVAKNPVMTVNPPIRGTVRNTKLTVEQIRACIMGRAIVDEILKDGSTVRLTLANYNKDNNPTVTDSDTEASSEDTVVETPVTIEETVEEDDEPVIKEAPVKKENEALKAIKQKVAERKAAESAAKEETAPVSAPAEDTVVETSTEEVTEEAVEESEEDIEEISDSSLPDTDEDGLEVIDVSELGL